MPNSHNVPAHLPGGTKYVLEAWGPFVRRYIELPSGRKIQLETRKAVSCKCAASQKFSVVPGKHTAVIDVSLLRPRFIA